MDDATSITAGTGGKVIVAGSGVKGASIMRLQSTGELDALFGDGGRNPPLQSCSSEFGSAPVVHDLAVRADGAVLAAGTDLILDQPFVIRLLQDGGGESRAWVSFGDYYVTPGEEDGQAVVHVRRSGGSAGDISVDYQTTVDLRSDCRRGLHGGIRYAELGRWRMPTAAAEIVVAVADNDDPPEAFESFHVTLGDPVGGAGIGTRNATTVIMPDGEPGGQISR